MQSIDAAYSTVLLCRRCVSSRVQVQVQVSSTESKINIKINKFCTFILYIIILHIVLYYQRLRFETRLVLSLATSY